MHTAVTPPLTIRIKEENGDISLISQTGKLRFRRPVNIYLIRERSLPIFTHSAAQTMIFLNIPRLIALKHTKLLRYHDNNLN